MVVVYYGPLVFHWCFFFFSSVIHISRRFWPEAKGKNTLHQFSNKNENPKGKQALIRIIRRFFRAITTFWYRKVNHVSWRRWEYTTIRRIQQQRVKNGETNGCQLCCPTIFGETYWYGQATLYLTKMFLDHLAENYFGALFLCIRRGKR